VIVQDEFHDEQTIKLDKSELSNNHLRDRNMIKISLVATVVAASLFTAICVGAKSPQSLNVANEEWLSVPSQSLVVEKGSPLDFSSLVPQGRYNCGMLQSGPHWRPEFPDHSETDLLVGQLKLHGYNLIRIQYIDYRLFKNSVITGAIDKVQLDRFYYLLYKLKSVGISWGLDIISRGEKSIGGNSIFEKSSPDDIRVRLHFDPAARQSWIKFVDSVYASKNPYTNQSILEDKNLVFITGANENGIEFSSKPYQKYPTGLDLAYDTWVKNLLKHDVNFRKKNTIIADEISRNGSAPLPVDWKDASSDQDIFRKFISYLEIDTYNWMKIQLKSRGFYGDLLEYHEWNNSLDNRTRSQLPIIDVHAYAGDVSNFAIGSNFVIPDISSNYGLDFALIPFGAQWAGKPMVMTEYGQPYPNEFRYQSGLFYPALASFQGFKFICRTAEQAVEADIPSSDGEKARGIRAYDVGVDPVERVNETMATVLFGRSDVSLAYSKILLPFGQSEMQYHSGFLTSDVRRSALLSRLLIFDPKNVDLIHPNSIVVEIPRNSQKIFDKIKSSTRDFVGVGRGWIDSMLDKLKGIGYFNNNNITDIPHGKYQSDTGELTVDTGSGLIVVNTQRSKAFSSNKPTSNIKVGSFLFSDLSSAGMVGAISLDGKKLEYSNEILFVISGDVRNNGMELSGNLPNATLVNWGKYPMMMKRVSVNVNFFSNYRHDAVLKTLSLRGSVLATKKVDFLGGVAKIKLDIGAVSGMPTNYFLLERVQQ